ncbi:MAG: hypothetical protein Q9196_006550, partial [Gyalolechia fulgens]
MDSVHSHSTDELVRMMKKIPLFMTDLDEAGGIDGTCVIVLLRRYYILGCATDGTSMIGDEENIQVEALRALQYEGTRAEIAQGFKERGSEMVAEKRWKDAKEYYTKGLLALKAPKETKGTPISDEDDDEAETVKEKQ